MPNLKFGCIHLKTTCIKRNQIYTNFITEGSSSAQGGPGRLRLGPQVGQDQGVHVLLQGGQDEDLHGSRHQVHFH